ncbi:unnamed protein product [Clonostachys rosea]|uniref:Uncharacterized protein n=1 Tax=Bionectria ochroleuca TaxID=29856 RepID=A0ABY6UY75_BIOOC|nr:unnamed protein product [Clonostachys rosea]
MSSSTKVAIVTGASSGLGRAISIHFAREGWSVVCADLKNSPPPGENLSTADQINAEGRATAFFVTCDVSDSESVQSLISAAVDRFGRLDVMVNNAGISLESSPKIGAKPIAETDESTFDKTMAVNARSVFLGCKYAIRQFLKQDILSSGSRGWIINTASVYGLRPEINHISYSTSKGAVVHMTQCVAKEYASQKIHCNAICPGFVSTGMDAHLHSDQAARQSLIDLHPWETLGNVSDVAKAAVYLAGESSSWITGVALPVDGGYTLGPIQK